MNTRISRHGQQGFSLIEALVAFIVVAFGMLGLAGMQLSLSRGADIAKQRSEATRLAQDKLEALRSFTGISTGAVNWNGLASGSDAPLSSYSVGGTTVPTNATYTRAWTVAGSASDAQRAVQVTVSWADRAGDQQQVALSSVIAQVDPKKVDFLLYPLPENTNLKRPKNRNLNIPIQATPVDSGRSAIKLGDFSVVFDNVNGYVVKFCSTSTTITAANIDSLCSNYDAYILAGYISGAVTNNGSGGATKPNGVNVSGITGRGTTRPIVCTYAQARDQNNANNSTNLISGYQYYLCVIPVGSSGGTWSGTVRLGGVDTSGNYKVCRVEYAASKFVNDNERNHQPYDHVGESLDNQNYYIASSNDNTCPTIGNSSYAGGSVATVLHQNCRSSTSPSTGETGTCPLASWNAPASVPTP